MKRRIDGKGIGARRCAAVLIAAAVVASLVALAGCKRGSTDVSPSTGGERAAESDGNATAMTSEGKASGPSGDGAASTGGGAVSGSQNVDSSPKAGAGSPGASDKGSSMGEPSSGSPGDVLVAYRRSGGFAGFQDSLDISRDGRVVVSRRAGKREMRLDPARLAKLEETLKKTGIDTIPAESTAKGADLFSYSLTYGGRTVTFMDTAVPPSLEDLIPRLNAILDEAMTPR